MRFKELNLSIKLFLLFVAGIYAVVSYWLFWPYVPIVLEPIKIYNVNKEVYPRESLIYSLDMDKRMALPAVITKQLVNDFIITYSPIIGNMPVGKHNKQVKLKIPRSAEPGAYKLRWEGIYKVNPMRSVSVIAWSEPFNIMPKSSHD